jgi:hypothetical protein
VRAFLATVAITTNTHEQYLLLSCNENLERKAVLILEQTHSRWKIPRLLDQRTKKELTITDRRILAGELHMYLKQE